MWFFSSIISGKYRRTVNTLKHCLLCESVFAFIPSLLFASTSLWPWQEVHHCEGSVQKKKKKRKEHTTVGGNVWLKWNEGDWKWHLKWALVFFCWRSDVCVRELFTFRVELFFFPLCWTEWKDATEKLTEEALHHWLFASDSHWRHLCTERQRLNPASKLVFVLLGSRPHYISSECALQPFWIAVM